MGDYLQNTFARGKNLESYEKSSFVPLKCIENLQWLLKTGSLDNAVRGFSLAYPLWVWAIIYLIYHCKFKIFLH